MEHDGARRKSPVLITDRDRELIGFIAEHRLVLAAHVGALLGISPSTAGGRLNALDTAGLLSREHVFHRQPPCYQVTRAGLGLIGSGLPTPRLDLRCYRHDIGVAWLWLAARADAFGEWRELIPERRLRSEDASAESAGAPHGVRQGGFGPGGAPRLHYPDLMLVSADGHRVALELELTRKGRARREKILAGYAADARIDAVLYLVDDAVLAREILGTARALGATSVIHVQPIRLGGAGRAQSGARTHQLARASGRGAGAAR